MKQAVVEQWEKYQKKEKMKWEMNLSPKTCRFLSQMKVASYMREGGQQTHLYIVYRKMHYAFATLYGQSILKRKDLNHSIYLKDEDLMEARNVLIHFVDTCEKNEEKAV